MDYNVQNERDNGLRKIRPAAGIETAKKSEVAVFETNSIQPILTFQASIVMAQFSQYLRKFKPGFNVYNQKVQYRFIEEVLKTDPRIKNSLIASVVSMMTLDEYAFYCANKVALNKIIIQLITEQIKSHIEMLY